MGERTETTPVSPVACVIPLAPNSHRHHRRDKTVESRRVGRRELAAIHPSTVF